MDEEAAGPTATFMVTMQQAGDAMRQLESVVLLVVVVVVI